MDSRQQTNSDESEYDVTFMCMGAVAIPDSLHYERRLLSRVLGAWSQWTQEEQAHYTSCMKTATAFATERLRHQAMQRWLFICFDGVCSSRSFRWRQHLAATAHRLLQLQRYMRIWRRCARRSHMMRLSFERGSSGIGGKQLFA